MRRVAGTNDDFAYHFSWEFHEDHCDLSVELWIFVIANGFEQLLQFAIEDRLSLLPMSFDPKTKKS